MRSLPATAILGVLTLSACKFSVDTNTAKFSCTSNADCGSGWVCVTQVLTGNGICFAADACHPETCNGLDDDCDGVVDDNIAAVGMPCPTTGPVCAAGVQACESGKLICVGQVPVQPERCDGITDLNCNGLVGCADPACVGTDACGPGCACNSDGGQHETDCGDGLDNDHNGLTDCEDPACADMVCGGDAGVCARTGIPLSDAYPDGGHDRASPRIFPDGGDGPDAGERRDGGEAEDGGERVDAGERSDAGRMEEDGGEKVDAGRMEDAGERVDAGPRDAGPEDAGPGDAGVYCAIPSTVCVDGSCP